MDKDFLQKHDFVIPSHILYGKMDGFNDNGILGCTIKNKLIDLWKHFFIFEEDFYEIETPIIMPFDSLKASGHVDRFNSCVVQDNKGQIHKAKQIIKNWFIDHNMPEMSQMVDGWTKVKLQHTINKYKMIEPIKNIKNKNKIIPIEVKEKNLMYAIASSNYNSQVGIDFLRPELAQGIFTNFDRIIKHTHIPFGIAQIGKVFKKEINPTSFAQLREFTQASIEYFFDPNNTKHEKYNTTKNENFKLPFIIQKTQTGNKNDQACMISLNDLITKGIICNEIMGYFLLQIYKFSISIGLSEHKIRFRQYKSTELAFYSNRCWSLEAFVNDKWLECIICSNRGCYDLIAHSNYTGIDLKLGKKELDEPIIEKFIKYNINKELISKVYRNLTPKIVNHFSNLKQKEILNMRNKIFKNNNSMIICIDNLLCKITKDMIEFEDVVIKHKYESYYPHVIEPSFYIDKLLYAVYYHCYWIRNNKSVLSLPYHLSPYNVAILPFDIKKNILDLVNNIKNMLKRNKLSCYINNSNKMLDEKYNECDNIGIKFIITVNSISIKNNKVSIRERDSMKQIIININEILKNVNKFNENHD